MKRILYTCLLLLALFPLSGIYAQIPDRPLTTSYTVAEQFSLEEQKGKVVVINIWSPEYPNEIATLNNLVKDFNNTEVVFIAVSDEFTENFLTNSPFYYQHVSGDEGLKIFNMYQKRMYKTYPIHAIIDTDGKTVFLKTGAVKNIRKKLEKRINLLLNKQAKKNLVTYK